MSEAEDVAKPSPSNFDEYVQWSCRQMQVDAVVVTVRIQPKTDDLSGRSRSKYKSKISPYEPKEDVTTHNTRSTSLATIDGYEVCKLITTYDVTGHLIEIKFDNNKHIACNVLKVIELILQFHTFLTKVTINRGLSDTVLKNLNDWLPLSNITNINLDNSALTDGNYDVLLKEEHLRHLSLARCRIDDNIIKNIASKLSYPLPASTNLSILNLTSNKVTDEGAKFIAEALRSNRQLTYINLSDNVLSDEGAAALFDVLTEFELSENELLAFRESLRNNLQYKDVKSPVIEETHISFDIQRPKQKSLSSTSNTKTSLRSASNSDIYERRVSKPKGKQRKSAVNLSKTSKEYSNVEIIPEFLEDPFSTKNIIFKNNKAVCLGNNFLSYLNLAYNDLSYLSVKHILNLLKYQKRLDRKPRGLVRIRLEGNCIPANCSELREIDKIIFDSVSGGKKFTRLF